MMKVLKMNITWNIVELDCGLSSFLQDTREIVVAIGDAHL